VVFSVVAPRGLDLAWSYSLSAACLFAFLCLLYWLCGTKNKTHPETRVRRFWYVVLGSDDRVSTSKVQFALWTVALAFALLVIVFHDFTYSQSTLDPRYLLLIGVPAGAAVGSKAIPSGQVTNGTSAKTSAGSPRKRLRDALREVISDDNDNLELGDTQYFVFNLVALLAFFVAFVHNPVKLPVLPDTLVGLTSASAAAYVAKKASTSTPLNVTAVTPQKGPPGTRIAVYGANLGCGTDPPTAPTVTVGGLTAAPVSGAAITDTRVDVIVPEVAGVVAVRVVTKAGQAALLPNAFEATTAPPWPEQYESWE
jgi:heme A synthase